MDFEATDMLKVVENAVEKYDMSDFAMITDVTEPTALKAMVEELRNEAGITDENIYSAVLDELTK